MDIENTHSRSTPTLKVTQARNEVNGLYYRPETVDCLSNIIIGI